jgi:hypothetical protein
MSTSGKLLNHFSLKNVTLGIRIPKQSLNFLSKMATDVFGDLSLFDEFEKDRSSSASFITFNITNEGNEDKSKILFKVGASDDESSESSSESDSESETENRINGTKVKDDDDDIKCHAVVLLMFHK